jgi:hypothetical protein
MAAASTGPDWPAELVLRLVRMRERASQLNGTFEFECLCRTSMAVFPVEARSLTATASTASGPCTAHRHGRAGGDQRARRFDADPRCTASDDAALVGQINSGDDFGGSRREAEGCDDHARKLIRSSSAGR